MANRRIHPRQRVTSLAYVDLGPANGGLVRNVSECGLALTAIAKLAGDELLSMRFELPKVHDWIEARGRIVWLSQSGKEAGLRFEQLPEAERKKIKNWISTAQSVNEQSSEKTAQEREAALDTMNVPQRAESQEPVVSPQARNTNETRIQERSPGQLEEPVAEFTTRAGHDGGPSQGAQEVLNAPHLKEASRRTPQRRAHARQTGSLEYVDLGPANGGMLLNLGEGGLALVSAMKLIGNQLTSIRFRLPNLQDPIEVRGRIVWLSESQKRAGIRFEELSADVLQSINRWISAEQSGNKEHGQDTAPIEKSFETTALVKPQEPLEEPVVAPALSEGTDRMERPQLSETGIPHPPEEPVPEFTMPMSDVEPPKDERDVSNMPQQLEGTSRKDERRAHARQPVGFLEYVDLGPANGGMLLNLGEGGLALTAAEKLTGDRLRMRLQLSGRQERIEASAQIVWLSESKKEAGVRFDELSADALQEIKNWISTEKCGHKESREGAAQDHKTFEPTGLPKQGEAGHEPLVFLAMAQITDELQERQPPGVHALLQSGKPAEPRYLTKPYVRPVPALLGVREPQDSATWRSIERRSVAGVRQRSRARSASVLALVALVSFGAGMVIARRFRGPGSSERTETKMERVEANGVSAGTDRQSAEALAVRAGQQPNRVRSQLKEDTYKAQQAQVSKAGEGPELRAFEAAQQGPDRSRHFGAAPAEKARSGGAKTSPGTSISSATSAPPALKPEQPAASRTSPGAKRRAEKQTAIARNEGKEGSLQYGRARPNAASAPPIVPSNASPAASAQVSASNQTSATKAVTPERSAVRPEIAGAARRDGASIAPQPASVVSANDKRNLPPSSTNTTKAATPERAAVQSEIASTAPRDGTSVAPQPASVVSANDKKNLVPLSTNASANSVSSGSASASGSIVITMPPFPSIRIPPQLKSQPSRLGTSLQMGQVASRIEPAYPPEATRQRMEGTVKLHATIGRDGAVQSVVATGPPLLADAAMSAVRQWRYGPTLLGGQAIEADEDIIVVFRLSAPPLTSK